MRRLLALALALIALVLAACPTGLLSWSNGPAGNATLLVNDGWHIRVGQLVHKEV